MKVIVSDISPQSTTYFVLPPERQLLQFELSGSYLVNLWFLVAACIAGIDFDWLHNNKKNIFILLAYS